MDEPGGRFPEDWAQDQREDAEPRPHRRYDERHFLRAGGAMKVYGVIDSASAKRSSLCSA
jgi:hypothetical protein